MTLVDSFAQPNTSVAEPFPLCLERPLGAVVTETGTQFALWAPSAQKVTLRLFIAWLHGGKRRRSDWTVHDASGIRWFLDVRFRRQHARRVLRLFDRTRLRFRRPHRRPVGARGRCERPAQHGRGLQPHQSGWLVPRPYAGRAACADGGLGNPCGRFQQ